MAEELSQDDIDSLLNSTDLENGDDSDDSVNEDARRFFNLLNDSIEEVLKTAFSLEVVSKFTDLEIISKDDISFDDSVFVNVRVIKEENSVNLTIIVGKRFASILSDLMLMGPGEAKDELEDDDLDALKELFSQIFGNFSTVVKENFSLPLGFEVESVSLESPPVEDNLYKAIYDIALPNIEDGIFNILSPKSIDEFFKVESVEIETPDEVPFKDIEEESSIETGDEKKASSGNIMDTPNNLDLIMDIDLEVKIRIGEKYMLIKDILDLKDGSIIELDKNIEEPMDILVNGKVVAKGVVVVVGGRFGVKITHIETKEERIKSLGG